MCRVAVRRPPQPSAVVPDQRAPGLETSPSLYEALEALSNDNIEDVKLGQFEEAEGELDDEFIALLHGIHHPNQAGAQAESQPPAYTEPQQQPVPVSYDAAAQAVAYTAQAAQAAVVFPADFAQAPLGIPAPLPNAQSMYQACMLPPPGFPYQQMLQQAYMEQQVMQQQAAAPNSGVPPMPATRKRAKTEEEQAIQEEMIKRRRRESAQRSRQRKAIYMHSLEVENKALKMENERLRMQLNKVMGVTAVTGTGSPSTTGSSEMKLTVQTSDSLNKEGDGIMPISLMPDGYMYMGLPSMM